jgi:hypothetical protein
MPYMERMAFDPDKWEVATYRQQSGYNCKLWDWKVWRGSQLMGSGTVEGTDSVARHAGQAELNRLRSAHRDY